jgi:hypothetical protein
VGPLALLFRERRFVNEEVRPVSHLDYLRTGPGVTRIDELPSRPGRTDQLLGGHHAAVRQCHRLALVDLSPERTLGDSKLASAIGIEAAQPDVLAEGVPDGIRAMVGLVDQDVVLLARQTVPGAELHDLDRELGPLDSHVGQPANDLVRGPGTVNDHWLLPILQAQRPDEAGDAKDVVGVIVGEKDFAEGEADPVPHHLPLGALAAIEQDGLPRGAPRGPKRSGRLWDRRQPYPRM